MALRADVRPLVGHTTVEWAVFLQPGLSPPTADAMLLGVVETEEAAQAIAAALNKVLGVPPATSP